MTNLTKQDPLYIGDRNSTDFSIQQYMDEVYSKAITINQTYWSEADTDMRFYAGDQTVIGDLYGNIPSDSRRTFNFNRIRRVVNMITGYQRQHRKSTIITALENEGMETADQFSEILTWINNTSNLYEIISEAFLGSVITGLNFLGVDLDFSKDPISGDIGYRNVPYSSFLVDPFFRNHDLSDCDYFWERRYVSRQQAMEMFPESRKKISSMVSKAAGSARDGRFYFLPENYGYSQQDLIYLDMFYYKDSRSCEILVDKMSGETREWNGEEEELKSFLRKFPNVEIKKSYKPTVKAAFLLQDWVVYHGENPLGVDCYPYVGFFGYYTPEIPHYPFRIGSVVKDCRDAQYLYGRRKRVELDILESQINSGFIYKQSALVNPDDIYLQGQGKGVALKREADMNDVQKIQPAQIPPSMLEISRSLAEEVQQISGVNEELLGSATDDKSGILSMLRQGAGLVTLQQLYDQCDQSQKQLGNITVEVIQKNFSIGKTRKIIHEDPTEEFFTKNWSR